MILGMSLCSCLAPVPVDVVMMGDELFFVLEEPHEISGIWVTAFNPNTRKKPKPMWGLGHDLTTAVKDRKYPRLKQIKYGQKFEEFTEATGPLKLQRNMEYLVGIDMGGKFARETFIITNDNKAVMPKPGFLRQNGRVYSVSVDKNGNETLILKPKT